MRPASITSIGGCTTIPPSSDAFAADASTSATVTYVAHTGGIPPAAISGESLIIPATDFPPCCAITYGFSGLPVSCSSKSQPKSAP